MSAFRDEVVQFIEASRVRSGYEREHVLFHMAHTPDPQYLAPSVERLNDWVAPVRAAARKSFIANLAVADGTTLLACQPAIDKLRRATRENHEHICGLYCQRVLAVLGRAELQRMIDGKDDSQGAFAFWVTTNANPEAWSDGASDRLSHRNPRLRAISLRWLQNVAPPEVRATAARAGVRSRDATVRKWALREIARGRTGDRDALLRTGLYDASATVRSICAMALDLSTEAQLSIARELADAHDAAPAHRREARRFFAQHGTELDRARLERYQQSDDVATRMAGTLGLMRLTPSLATAMFEQFMMSLRGKALTRMLVEARRLGYTPAPAFTRNLWSVLTAADRRRLWPTIRTFGRWECWCFAAAICQQANTSGEELIGVLNHQRLTNTYVRPSPAQLQELRERSGGLARALVDHQLQLRLRDDLRFAGL